MNKPPFQLRRLDHVVLRVRDLAAMQAFYCEVLGCTVERRQDEIGLLQLRAGDSLIDLVPVDGKLGRMGGAAPGEEGRNLDHLCLSVAPFEREEILAHLQTHGVRIGEFGLRYGAEGEGPSQYLSDPEGNVVELKGPPDRAAHAGAGLDLAHDASLAKSASAFASAADASKPLVFSLLDVMKREPVLFVTFGYLFVSFIGLWANYWYYSRFGLPVLEYMQASDFLVAGLREPRYALVLAAMLGASILFTWPSLWRKRNPERVERMRRKWWGRLLFPNWKLFRWPGMAPETGLAIGFFWGAIWLLFAYVVQHANEVRAGGGHAVEVTLATSDKPLAGEARLLGTSSAFVFLWWPADKRAEAVPIESIGRIESLRSLPGSDPAPTARVEAKTP